jgi:P-type Cu+ transporter
MGESETAARTASELHVAADQKQVSGPGRPVTAADHDEPHQVKKIDLVRIGLVGLAVAVSFLDPSTVLGWIFFHGQPGPHFFAASWLHRFDLIPLVATLAGGYPLFRGAFHDIRQRRMTMELSMTIALAAALLVGEFRTALVIAFFVLIAEVLEELTLSRGRRAIKELLDLLPRKTLVRQGDVAEEVDAEQIRLNDIVVVKPGARLPVDGVAVKGHSFVDESSITGESMPVEKMAGTQVYAGTINQSGALEVRALRLGRDTAYGKIIEAVERAEKSRAPVQKLADRLAGYIVYFAVGCSALTFLITRDIRSSISVIVVAGACGIAAGTPLAILGAIGQSARHGTIVKGGLYIELLAKVDTIALDKTGTLTFGNPEVKSVCPLNGASTEEIVEAAGVAERLSEHPLGKAILKRASEMGLSISEPERFEYVPGKGVSCWLDKEPILVGNRAFLEAHSFAVDEIAPCPDHLSEIVVSRGQRLLGTIQIADVTRPEAGKAVKSLRAMGLRTLLLTGDSAAIAQDVARTLGVDEVDAQLLPEEKLARIDSLMAEGRRVAMVGDGVNDAPALMRATVGVALASGTDVARESANIVLLGNDLLKFVETLGVARRCYQVIMTNFFGTLLIDAVGVGLAAYGLLDPMLAALIHVSSEMAFILNSARLLPAVSMPGGSTSAAPGVRLVAST